MDYSLPIAKRTRLREALMFKEYYEKKRRKRNVEVVEEEEAVDGVGSSMGERLNVEEERGDGLEKLGFECSVEGNGKSEEESCEEISGGDCVVVEEEECSGSTNVEKLERGFRVTESVVSIDLVDSDDDELVVIGEEDGLRLTLNEEGGDNGVGTRGKEMDASTGVNIDCRNHDIETSVDSEDEDDGEDTVDEMSKSVNLEQSSSSYSLEEEGEEDDSKDVDGGGRTENVAKEGKWRSLWIGGKEVKGIDVLFDDEDGEDSISVAQRTRSPFSRKKSIREKNVVDEYDEDEDDGGKRMPRKHRKNKCRKRNYDLKKVYITAENVVDEDEQVQEKRRKNKYKKKDNDLKKECITEKNVEDEREEDDDVQVLGKHRKNKYKKLKTDLKKETIVEKNVVDEFEYEGVDEDNNDKQVPAKRKKNKYKRKNYNVDKILVNLIWEKGEKTLEDLDSAKDEPNEETSLPLQWVDLQCLEESIIPPEKTEYEKELDDLWAEMELGIRSSAICSTDDDRVENKDSCPVDYTDVATQCHQGNHELILDEQIGLKCKFCSFVKLEIKYIVASFDDNLCGRGDRAYYNQFEHSLLHGINYFDSSDIHSNSDPHALPEDTVWDIIPGIKYEMYPHQREGFEFIWKNIAGGIHIDKMKNPSGDNDTGGCIISHAPGTGKTRLTLVFLLTFMKLFPTCRPVIIAPSNMLLTWEEEFQKWKVGIPFHNLNNSTFSGKENMAAVNLLRHAKYQNQNVKSARLVKLYSWKKDISILGISYTLFENLVDVENKKGGQHEAVQVKRMLLELPSLLVLDEGHTPRNERTKLWKALSRIQTQRRIILSGTPFQNNFDELYNTLRLVRPKFASKIENSGNYQKKSGRRKNEERSKWASLINSIDQVRAMIDPFVHIHRGSILRENLPGLRDSVVVLHPLPLQKSLLSLLEDNKGKEVLTWAHNVSLVSVHPSLFSQSLLSDLKDSCVDRAQLENLALDPDAGVKTKFVMKLIWLSQAIDEKVLVFCQYLDPLTLILKQLEGQFGWTEGNQVLQMDGQTGHKQRQSIINVFNNPTSDVKVLLASTTACCEGISLVGASRVVLLDVVWNPSVEMQAISRAYRLGQKKLVYVYHLIASGTMESEKYCRQAEKDRLSKLVFSCDRDGHTQKISSEVSEDKILEEMAQHDKLKHMFEKIIRQPKEHNLLETFGLVDSAQASSGFCL